MPSCPLLSLCPMAAAGRVGKGQRAEATVAKPEKEAQLWSRKRNEETKELGDRGRGGVRVGKDCPGVINLSRSWLYEADSGLSLNFAQEGVLASHRAPGVGPR